MPSRSTQTRYAVITADVVGSRKIRSFRAKRDRLLASVSQFHLEHKLILSPWTVTAWDEFRQFSAAPSMFPR